MPQKRSATILATILIIGGILVTFENYGVITGVTKHWPILVLVNGSGFILLFFQKERSDLALLWIGSFMCLVSILFYYLNFTGWRELVSLWPVFLGVVGFSFLSVAIWGRNPMYYYFAIAFIGLFVTFSLVFSISTRLWPMSLAVFGLSLLIIQQVYNRSG